MVDNTETCCPRFNTEPWDGKEITWEDKQFVQDRVRSFFHIPLNFGSVMKRNAALIEIGLTPRRLDVKRFSLLLLTACLLCAARADAADENRASVVKIHVTQRFPDFSRPWTKASPRKSAGSGVVIEGKRILTNAHVVLYASQIFVQADQATEKTPASVVAMAPGVDLALIELEDEDFFKGRPALALAEGIPNLKQTVNVYGYPIGGEQLSVTEGIISRIECTRFHYMTVGLRIQVDAALNPGNSGGPAIADGRIAGLVFSTFRQAENIGYLIAAEEIKMFLDDVQDGTYDGKLMMFDHLQSAENEVLRERLALEKGAPGMMVTRPYVEDESYPLKEWDVITHVGSHEVDSQGNVQVKDDLKLAFAYFVPKLATLKSGAGGKVPLTVLRDKKTLKIDLPVCGRPDYVMPFLNGTYPRFFIHGPMVFTTASQDLIVRLGAMGQTYLRRYNSPLVYRQYGKPAFPGEEIVMLGARLFPHRVSKGYSSMSFAVVREVNGVEVKNLSHLVETLRDASGEHLTLKFAGEHETLVFRRKEVEESTEEILDNEGIRRQYSDDLEEIWRGEQ